MLDLEGRFSIFLIVCCIVTDIRMIEGWSSEYKTTVFTVLSLVAFSRSESHLHSYLCINLILFLSTLVEIQVRNLLILLTSAYGRWHCQLILEVMDPNNMTTHSADKHP